MKIVSIGEILWDVFPDGSEHLGGATFNFSVNARRLGHDVLFLSAVGNDERGRRARQRAAELGLPVEWIRETEAAATGNVTLELDSARQPHFTLHRPAAYDHLALSPQDLQRLSAFAPDWLCYGTLTFVSPHMMDTLGAVVQACAGARQFCDINLRKDAWSREMVLQVLSFGAAAVKMNEQEAAAVGDLVTAPVQCVTRAESGCTVRIGDDHADAPGYRVDVADAVGAGDAFSAAFLHGLAQGWPASRTGDFANRVGALVASRRGATPEWTVEEALELVRSR